MHDPCNLGDKLSWVRGLPGPGNLPCWGLADNLLAASISLLASREAEHALGHMAQGCSQAPTGACRYYVAPAQGRTTLGTREKDGVRRDYTDLRSILSIGQKKADMQAWLVPGH